jgi:hypothetical protein
MRWLEGSAVLGQEAKVFHMKCSLYGFMQLGQNWAEHLNELLNMLKWVRSRADPAICIHTTDAGPRSLAYTRTTFREFQRWMPQWRCYICANLPAYSPNQHFISIPNLGLSPQLWFRLRSTQSLIQVPSRFGLQVQTALLLMILRQSSLPRHRGFHAVKDY